MDYWCFIAEKNAFLKTRNIYQYQIETVSRKNEFLKTENC
jgi:hypothetical protein